MSIFARPHYMSEATQFLNALKAQRPELDAQQALGRSLLWDKKVDSALWQDYKAGKVAQKPYPYQTNPNKD